MTSARTSKAWPALTAIHVTDPQQALADLDEVLAN